MICEKVQNVIRKLSTLWLE